MAEAVMRHKIAQAGLDGDILVDSAGTSRYHPGDPPHKGTRHKLDEMGISYEGIFARQITRQDLDRFDYIICMDRENYQDCLSFASGDNKNKLCYFADFAPGGTFSHGKDVPDPWYTGNFDQTYDLADTACAGLLEYLQREEL